MSEPILLDGSAVVAGKISPPEHGAFSGVDPTTGAALKPLYAEADETMIAASCDAAAEAFRKEGGSTAAAAEILLRWADLLELHREQIIERGDLETGLGYARLGGELVRTTTQLRFLAARSEAADTLDAVLDRGDDSATPPVPDLRRVNRPIGPVAVFAASNFPLAFSAPGGDTASALAAGCPVVVKAHPAHPGTAELVARLAVQAVADAGMNPGWFSLLHGTKHSLGSTLVQHPEIRAVAFTGSLAGGRALFDIAATRPNPIPVYAEMGSLNPSFVFPDALSSETSTALVDSLMLGVGQFCTKPGIIVVPDDASGQAFAQQLGHDFAGRTAGTMLTAAMSSAVSQLAEASIDAGATTQARQEAGAGEADIAGVLLQTSLTHFLETPELSEEHFGPVALIVHAPAEAFARLYEAIPGSLTASVFAGDAQQAHLGNLLETSARHAGRVLMNQVPTGVRVSPAMVHGGPYPSTTAASSTSVGSAAIRRFLRPVSYQNLPDAHLPAALKNENPLGVLRLVDGVSTAAPMEHGPAHD
jgi:2,5-dioxopentanoate dehydrogenase